MIIQTQVIIGSNIDDIISSLKEVAQEGDRFIPIIKDGNFLMEDASLAIEKAYLASKERVIIILAGKSFSKEVQSKLLKILEEPPPNKIFILIMPSKSMVLPTISSRLPIVKFEDKKIDEVESGIDVSKLDIGAIFEFVKSNRYTQNSQLSAKLQKIFIDAIRSGLYDIDSNTLNLFSDITKALDKGSPPDFVASTALLKLLSSKKREL